MHVSTSLLQLLGIQHACLSLPFACAKALVEKAEEGVTKEKSCDKKEKNTFCEREMMARALNQPRNFSPFLFGMGGGPLGAQIGIQNTSPF